MAISKILNMKDCGGHFHGKHLKRALDYVMNPDKTQDGRLVGAINCQVDTAFEQMKETKRNFGKIDKRQGYHIILSFKENEVNPDTAFEITQITKSIIPTHRFHCGRAIGCSFVHGLFILVAEQTPKITAIDIGI